MHLKVLNKVRTFFANRYIENEFIDFKTEKVVPQFTEIYTDLGVAYKRKDKVTLSRSLSQSMRDYTFSLMKEDAFNPYLQKVSLLRPVQARIY